MAVYDTIGDQLQLTIGWMCIKIHTYRPINSGVLAPTYLDDWILNYLNQTPCHVQNVNANTKLRDKIFWESLIKS